MPIDKPEEDVDDTLYGFDTSGFFEIPVEWDILVSASDTCLDGYAPGFVEKEIVKQLPASITYRIWQNELGELGTVEIRKLRPGVSLINISGISLGSEDTSPVWLRDKLEWDKRIKDAIQGLPKEEAVQAYLAISKEVDKAKKRIKAKQKNHQANIIKAYFNRLEHEDIWVKVPESLQSEDVETTARKIKGGRPRNRDDDWAYEQVRVEGRDKQEVYAKWLEKIGTRKDSLLNPKDSFDKAVSPKRGKKK